MTKILAIILNVNNVDIDLVASFYFDYHDADMVIVIKTDKIFKSGFEL